MNRKRTDHQDSEAQRKKRSEIRARCAGAPRHPSGFAGLGPLIGNRALGYLIQAKLRVGEAGDAFEQEADRVADQVMLARQQVSSGDRFDSSVPRQLNEKDGVLQTKALVGARPALSVSADSPVGALHSAGQALAASEQAFFEQRLGADFSAVRIHTDAQAAASADAMHARAYTQGAHIVFAQHHYAPQTPAGRRLIAHELTHVLQQSAVPVSRSASLRQGAMSSPVSLRAPQPLIQRDQPPRPSPVADITVAFADLPEGERISDPTGRLHGITIERRGDELFYHLPPPSARSMRVPHRMDRDQTPPVREPIHSIVWGGQPAFQTAFSVEFGSGGLASTLTETFSVNVHGAARSQSLTSMFSRQAADWEMHPQGVSLERRRSAVESPRPTAARFGDANRYHMDGAAYSMYVFSNRNVEVIEDASGNLLAGPWTHLVDLQVSPAGDVRLTWNDPVGIATVSFDLRGSWLSLQGEGVLPEAANRATLLTQLAALGVRVHERGSRFSEIELAAALEVINGWQGASGLVPALLAQGVSGLTLIKDVRIDGASYNTSTGELKIPAEMVADPVAQRSAMIHELTHGLFHAAGLFIPRTGNVPPAVAAQAQDLHELSDLGLIDEGVIFRGGSPLRTRRTEREWAAALSQDVALNNIWNALHDRFLIGDPEGSLDIRGMDVADESRYMGGHRGDPVGHAFDNVTEFISSFVTSSLQFQGQMSLTVERSASLSLAFHYSELWRWVDQHLIGLGSSNPYTAVIARIRAATPAPTAPPTPVP